MTMGFYRREFWAHGGEENKIVTSGSSAVLQFQWPASRLENTYLLRDAFLTDAFRLLISRSPTRVRSELGRIGDSGECALFLVCLVFLFAFHRFLLFSVLRIFSVRGRIWAGTAISWFQAKTRVPQWNQPGVPGPPARYS
jgi:hypothetical protein